MDSQFIQDLFFWCLIINIAIYSLTSLAIIFLRDFACRINMRIFSLDQNTVLTAFLYYLAAYKLLLTIFIFSPWLALVILLP